MRNSSCFLCQAVTWYLLFAHPLQSDAKSLLCCLFSLSGEPGNGFRRIAAFYQGDSQDNRSKPFLSAFHCRYTFSKLDFIRCTCL